jgi:hypothetical protein
MVDIKKVEYLLPLKKILYSDISDMNASKNKINKNYKPKRNSVRQRVIF